MGDLVSVVIPVYKTEKFIRECMDSVLSQNYPYIEVILVDDGSPDGAGAICDDYAGTYSAVCEAKTGTDGAAFEAKTGTDSAAQCNPGQGMTVRVIHKENSGVALSRNEGVKAACGKYIYFLDSDDRLDGEDAIGRLVEAAKVNDADITVSCFRRFNGHTVSGVNCHNLRGGKYTATARFRFDGFYRYGHLSYNWGKLYKRSFLVDNGLWCRPYPFTQDKAHNMACYACRPVYAFVDGSTYLYRVNENSVTFKYKENLIPVWVSIGRDYRKLLDEMGIGADYDDLIAFHVFFGSFFVAKQEMVAGNGVRAAAWQLKRYGKYAIVRKCMARLATLHYMSGVSSFKYRLMVWGASVLFTCHGYLLMAAMIKLLLGAGIDGVITRSHYKK